MVASKHWTETRSFEWSHCLVQILQSHQRFVKKWKPFLIKCLEILRHETFLFSLRANVTYSLKCILLKKKMNPWSLKGFIENFIHFIFLSNQQWWWLLKLNCQRYFLSLESILKCLSSMVTKIYLPIVIVLCCYKECSCSLWYFDGNSPVIICR